MPNQEGTATDITQLATQARTAYAKKHVRECLELTKALAQADPGNFDAASLQAAIHEDMRRDLDDARALLAQSGASSDGNKYRRAAELILVKLLRLDPAHEEAKNLLQTVRVSPQTPAEPPPPESPLATEWAITEADSVAGNRAPESVPQAAPERLEIPPALALPAPSPVDIPFTAVLLETKGKKSGASVPVGLIALVVLAVGVFFMLRPRGTDSGASAAVEQTEPARPRSLPPRVTSPEQSTAASENPVDASTVPSAATLNLPVPPPVDPVAAMGKLAISSATAAEIYIGGRYVGATPTTLELPAGHQTLEYRHGELHTTLVHDIKPNETVTANVAFQVTLQVNAKPWAQVFLDGATRRPLGQTPLSGVTVPIGGILVFENPNFASKNYRITDKDTAIQVDFE